ncbi:MAG: exo-alpha-sialidase [Sterolibacterium sp.]|jgi:hypothetical protein|nr:exo-alpha-sialidase [Sterolibacterium sp.]
MSSQRKILAASAAAALLLTQTCTAHAESPTALVVEAAPHKAAAHERSRTWQAILARPSLAVALAFDEATESSEAARLWRVVARDGLLLASYSDDLGRGFSSPVRVNAEPESILGDGENRPKLVVQKGVLYVSWTHGLSGPMTGDIRFSRSLDGGRSFTTPLTVNDNREVISHRFDALTVDRHGHVALAWLDKRDLQAAQKAGQPYSGAAVYVAESLDGGKSFSANRKLADHSCECCRIGLAQDADGVPVALWRHIYAAADGSQIRDFAIARFNAAAQRTSEDGWQLNGCPHHGGALAIDTQGRRHLSWFTGAKDKAGLWYRHIDGQTAHAAQLFADGERQPAHASLQVQGDAVFIAWQEYDSDAQVLRIQVMHSRDRGEHWSVPVTQAMTAHAADYAQLIRGRGKVWLVWNTADEGLRLWPLEIVAGPGTGQP